MHGNLVECVGVGEGRTAHGTGEDLDQVVSIRLIVVDEGIFDGEGLAGSEGVGDDIAAEVALDFEDEAEVCVFNGVRVALAQGIEDFWLGEFVGDDAGAGGGRFAPVLVVVVLVATGSKLEAEAEVGEIVGLEALWGQVRGVDGAGTVEDFDKMNVGSPLGAPGGGVGKIVTPVFDAGHAFRRVGMIELDDGIGPGGVVMGGKPGKKLLEVAAGHSLIVDDFANLEDVDVVARGNSAEFLAIDSDKFAGLVEAVGGRDEGTRGGAVVEGRGLRDELSVGSVVRGLLGEAVVVLGDGEKIDVRCVTGEAVGL